MSGRRKRSNFKMQRYKNAASAIEHLASVMLDSSLPMLVRKNAAIHLKKTASHNKISIRGPTSHMICRKCMELLIPGETSRIRIRGGQRVTTCLQCGFIRRFGGGNKAHRRHNDG